MCWFVADDPFAVATCKVIGHVHSLNNIVCKTFTVLNENKIVALELNLRARKHLANVAKIKTLHIKSAVQYLEASLNP